MNYSSENTLLYIEDLSVTYGDKTIIKDINLVEKDVVRQGEITGQVIAVVGRSGTGKSTFFRALTGLVKPSTGKVLIANTTVVDSENNAKAVCEGDIGFVDQKYTLFSSGHYMVLDEPFCGLDIGNIQDVKNAFKLITKTHEFNTIIYSTHDIELAVELADSIYVIGYPEIDGEKMTYGTIIKHFDMKEIGLAWKEFGLGHLDIVKQIKTVMLQS